MLFLLLLLLLTGLGSDPWRGLQFAYCQIPGIFCDFEKPCAWRWIGFIELSGDRINKTIFEDPTTQISGPVTDAADNPQGHFLYVAGGVGVGKAVELTSPWYEESGSSCRISVALHMHNMEDANLKLLVETRNHTWVVMETLGDSLRQWRVLTQNVGRIRQPFRFKWELLEGLKTPAHAAIDNLTLDRCLTEIPTEKECFQSKRAFRCNDERCLGVDQVCDISVDCLAGEDEEQDCEQLPFGARCDFESGWCGWSNTHKDDTDWIRHNGTTPTFQTGPSSDHTYKNSTGMYAYVDMSSTNEIGNAAILQSPRFPPPPRYHSNPNSPYFNSCQVRFFYHLFGPHIGDLVVRVVEEDARHGRTLHIWREHRNLGDLWRRAAVSLPHNIKYWYSIQFVGKRGIRFRGDVAIDDVSLSPECFGIGVPDNETTAWSSETPSSSDDSEFTRFTITTCGAKGRLGPTALMCERSYRGSVTRVQVISEGRFAGAQLWTVPKTTLYTIIARGASGGTGSSSYTTGSGSHGSLVRAVFRLAEGTQVYFVVGQEGTSSGRFSTKRIKGHTATDPVTDIADPTNVTDTKWGVERIRKVKNFPSKDGGGPINGSGGGGGGATFVFTMNAEGTPSLLLVAGGGGGMGSSQDTPNVSSANGRALHPQAHPTSGHGSVKGVGGYCCEQVSDWLTHGGFGGGSGACLGGGGGGGYTGGNASSEEANQIAGGGTPPSEEANQGGEGGYSFVGPDAIGWSVAIETGRHLGPGVVDVLPALEESCDCSFLCVTLNFLTSEKVCVCPEDWELEENGTACSGLNNSSASWSSTSYLIGLVVAVVVLLAIFGLICAFLYNRYQRQKLATLRRKAMAATELQLSHLRGTSSGMLTEYNPNYEFATGCYPGSIQDLKEIPRENLRLIKALGQGAFGEVYQGYLRHVVGDSVEMAVAVKTLPELSSNQAEMDFLMEALIMSKFHHANIVHFIGVCFDKHPRFIILELLSGGDLKTFLRESRPKPERVSLINMRDLLKCALDVAKGCRYLEENHFIHRDIAARNCLLTTKGPGRVVKIADFGMARDIYRADYYRKGGKAMLPVKWMPPEAFLDGIFTSKTDVWSFGVLLWEVMSLGYMPYPGRGNQEVMQLVTNGGRLEPPPGCPPPVYRVMTQCWNSNPDDRPSFATVLERIGYCMQDPDVLATPLPIFHRLPSSERDTTVVRPSPATYGSDTADCLQVLRPLPPSTSNDYLIPLGSEAETEATTTATSGIGTDEYWETSFEKNSGQGSATKGYPEIQDSSVEVQESCKRRSGGYSQIPENQDSPTSVKMSQSQSTQPLLEIKSDPGSPVLEINEQSYANIQVTPDKQKLLPANEIRYSQ